MELFIRKFFKAVFFKKSTNLKWDSIEHTGGEKVFLKALKGTSSKDRLNQKITIITILNRLRYHFTENWLIRVIISDGFIRIIENWIVINIIFFLRQTERNCL